jgi:hypothetical protein
MRGNQAREHHASFPAGAVNQKCGEPEFSGAALPPVLAGIRAPKSNRIAFPCVIAQWRTMRPAEIISALVYRCGGSTRLFVMNACFPFNCAPETTRGHQNNASVVV